MERFISLSSFGTPTRNDNVLFPAVDRDEICSLLFTLFLSFVSIDVFGIVVILNSRVHRFNRNKNQKKKKPCSSSRANVSTPRHTGGMIRGRTRRERDGNCSASTSLH